MMLLVAEVAPIVMTITTQPCVFEYTDGDRMRRYTPDLALDTTVGAFYVEVKDETSLVEGSKNVERLRAALKHLKECGERLFIVLRSDLIENDLQCRLTQILRTRPIRRRHRSDIDASLWDPEGGTTPPADIHEQWESAKRECDALLRRIMKRDPDGLLPQRAR
ncbi:Tn7 transposase TnsA N-terminal domain-containing protein [Pandoraea sputorum]